MKSMRNAPWPGLASLLVVGICSISASMIAAAQPYRASAVPESKPPVVVQSMHCVAVDNCSFETGAFPTWIPTDLAVPFFALTIGGAGITPGFGLFASAPTEGALAVLHGFDGAGPGDIVVEQDVVLPAGTRRLQFDYRAGWDMLTFGGSTLPRTFAVEIQPSGGGAPLQSDLILTAPPATMKLDTGSISAGVNVNAFAGQAVRIAFHWFIPEAFTGPAFFQLDNVTLDVFAPARTQLYGSTRDGVLIAIDVTTGAGTQIGPLPHDATEIEYQPLTGKAFVQARDGAFFASPFDINTGAALGPPVINGASYTGLEYVNDILYGTAITGGGGFSELRKLDPTTGGSSLVGPTGLTQIPGLAYHVGDRRLYGLTGGAGVSNLVSINPLTGAAAVIGPAGFQGGGLAVGPDGRLYGSGTGINAGELWRIDRVTGAGILVGPTGFGPVTGLTLRRPSSALFGSSQAGELFTIDIVTGAGIPVGILPTGATEIEYEPVSGRAWVQGPDGSFSISEFNIRSAAGIGAPIIDGFSFNGLEYVDLSLYGTAISFGGGPSDLRILNPVTGASLLIGPTGYGPIAGLAYDAATATMYGVGRPPGPGGGPPSDLVTIDLTTGAATFVGPTGFHLGSLQFGEDGNLYAGGTGAASGNLYRVNRVTGTATLVGPTGFATVTGLTLLNAASGLYGCSKAGDLLTIDVTTGAATLIGPLPHGATEIAFDPVGGRSFVQAPDGAFFGSEFDINTGAPLAPPVANGFSFTGLSYIGGRLYGTTISGGGGGAPSTLRILNPASGVSVAIGLTGLGSISGLAYDIVNDVLYGLTGGPPPSSLVTIDRTTGVATVIGATTFQGGGLGFGADGNLYGGGTGFNTGELWRINPLNATSVLVGPTGYLDVTGLTSRYVILPLDVPTGRVAGPRIELSTGVPNPSRRDALFRFSIPKAGDATFEIVDVTGRRVWASDQRGLAAGAHSLIWDGRDPEGGQAPTGVYFARLRSLGEEVTQKFARIR